MVPLADHAERISAALRGAAAAERDRPLTGPAAEMLGVAESLAAIGSLDLDDLRSRQLTAAPAAGPAAMLVRVLPFGLATPHDRPRLRRNAYRCAAAAAANEGVAVACVGAALVAADLMSWDAATTAIRVRQSLLEDAPMALLNRFALVGTEADLHGDDDAGAALQLALSAIGWPGRCEVSSVIAALGESGRGPTGTLAAAFAGAATGRCDVPVDEDLHRRADAAAEALAGAVVAAAAG